jgi:hypothetical protein
MIDELGPPLTGCCRPERSTAILLVDSFALANTEHNTVT